MFHVFTFPPPNGVYISMEDVELCSGRTSALLFSNNRSGALNFDNNIACVEDSFIYASVYRQLVTNRMYPFQSIQADWKANNIMNMCTGILNLLNVCGICKFP